MAHDRETKRPCQLRRLFGVLSIRRKIAFALLLSFVFTLPSAVLSLLYLSGLSVGIDTITERDVKLGRHVADLKLIMLDIRRDERNYMLSGSRDEESAIRNNIGRAKTLIGEIRNVAPAEDLATVGELLDQLDVYSNTFDILVEHVGSSTSRSALLSSIRENLESSRQSFLAVADMLSEKSWSYMEAHKESNLQLDARARRNILTVIILTLIICILIVTYFPRYIVKPITTLDQTFRKVEAGDFDTQAWVRSSDEIGDLAVTYNRMMSRLKQYDDLKTAKIVTQKRSIDRLLDTLEVPACILTENLRATYYNPLFINLFGSSLPAKAPETGLEITKIPEMDDLVKEVKANINQARNTFLFRKTRRDGSVQVLKGQLVRDHVMNLVAVVLVGITV